MEKTTEELLIELDEEINELRYDDFDDEDASCTVSQMAAFVR